MLGAMDEAMLRLENAPGTRLAHEMHDVLQEFKIAHENGREPNDAEVKGFLSKIAEVLESEIARIE